MSDTVTNITLNFAFMGVVLLTAGTMNTVGLPLAGIVAVVGGTAIFMVRLSMDVWNFEQ